MKRFQSRRCFTIEYRDIVIKELRENPNVSEIDIGFIDDYINDLHYYLITWYEN